MKKTLSIALLMVVLLGGLFVLTACGNGGNTIVGSWKNDSYGSSFTYTFNADGTGKYDAAGTIMEFTYTTNENKISILYTGNTASFDTEYSIDGDTLNVKDSLGSDTFYKRVK